MGNTDWHKIIIKLYPILLEKSLKELGLPSNSYSLLGGGSNGQAYLSNGRVYKITTDKSEAIESDKLIGKDNTRISNIFDVKRINNTLTKVEVFLIVLEKLKTNNQSIFEEIQTKLIQLFETELNIHLFDVIYFYRFNPTIYKNEYEQEVYRILDAHQREKYYYNSLLQIVDELKANNIQSLDIQYHNLGIKPNGNLAYFDIGSGDVYGKVRSAIDIGEGTEIVNEYISQIRTAIEKQNITIEELAKKISQKIGYDDITPTLIGRGTQGYAFDLNNDIVLKITSDKTEANEAIKLIGKNNSHIGNFYKVYGLNEQYEGIYAIVREKLIVDERKFDEIYNDFYDLIGRYDIGGHEVKEIIIDGNVNMLNNIKSIINNNQDDQRVKNAEQFYGVINELYNEKIKSIDFNAENFGFKKNGDLAYYDIGYSENKNNANFDALTIDERVMTYMKNSSAVSVKKNCQLAGNGNTSDACDQGDISNITLKPISENFDEQAYRKWKRDNVTYRGISDTSSQDGENGGMAMLGQGLYSVPASNKTMARKYGKLHILVNAKPKNPKVFNTLNEWEIWFQNNVVLPISKAKGKTFPDGRDVNSITDEMIKLGYDGIIIKGREIVNYKPENVRYYHNERQLEMYYDDNVAPNKINEHTGKWNQKYQDKITSIVEFELEGMNEGIHAYHGTPNKFDQFSVDKIGSSDGREVGGWGIYFSDDVSIANDYRSGNGTVMEVELRNGKYFNFDEGLDDDIANDIVNRGLRKGLSEEDIEQFQSDFMDEQYRYDITNKQVYEWLSAVLGGNKAASTYLSSAGYIGNKFSDKTNPNATNYVIFDPNNIKIVSNGEELDEEDQVQQTNEFDLKTFDSLKSFAARKKYADERLQKIGAGSSRIVYHLNNGNVLKLASNKKGLDQNENECGLGQDNYFSDLLAKIVDCDQNNLWVVSQEAKKITPLRFEELTGANFASFGTLLTNIYWDNKGRGKQYKQDQAIVEKLYESDFVHQMIEMMNSYALTAGDLTRIDSYGEINGDVVLKDYGIDDSTWDKHYDKSKSNRRMYENYFDMNEEVKVDINDLPFKADVEQAGGKIYSVGGAVRDKLLGKESKDLDILITGIPLDQLEQILHKHGKVDNVGKSFGIIKFNTPQTGEIDIAIPRTERKNDTGGYQGFDVTSDHTLPIEKDLERRDFTINAIAKDSSGLMIDPYGGQGDIEKKQIKMVNPQAFSDDPLRMLRAVQFAARFGFEIEPETMQSIQQNASKIKEISPERILIEFDKIVKKGNPTLGAKLLRQTGLYANIFGTNKGINIAGFDRVKTMGEFIFKLIGDNMRSPSEFYKNNMKGDLDSYNEIKALELGRKYDDNGSKKTIFDMYKIYPNSINTEVLGQYFKIMVKNMKYNNIPFSLKEVPVNGNDLMELGYAGKQIGDVFVHLLKQIYAEKLPNEREAILNYLKTSK